MRSSATASAANANCRTKHAKPNILEGRKTAGATPAPVHQTKGKGMKLEQDSNVTHVGFRFSLPVRNPVPVYDGRGKLLGSAHVTFVEDGLLAEAWLDRQTPEAFDLEVNPRMVKAKMSASVDELGLFLSITLEE